MDWSKRLSDNPEGHGDPVTALYLPSGYLVATSFPLAAFAIEWIARLSFGKDAGRVLRSGLGERTCTTVRGLHALADRFLALDGARRGSSRYAPDEAMPVIGGLRAWKTTDGAAFHAFRVAPYRSSVTLTVRPHDARRDGTPAGPPLIGLEWEAPGPGRDEGLRLPESLAAAVRRCSVAWPDTRATGLVSVVFKAEGNLPVPVTKRWSMLGIEWPANEGGVACFDGRQSVVHLVTLPRKLASPLIRTVADGSRTLYGGESYYLDGLTRHQFWQTV